MSLPKLTGQLVPFHLYMRHQGKSLMTSPRTPERKWRVVCLRSEDKSIHTRKWQRNLKSMLHIKECATHTSFLPVKSAAALMLPSRWIFDANWVVITLPFAADICLKSEFATTVSLNVLPGDSMFVESLII